MKIQEAFIVLAEAIVEERRQDEIALGKYKQELKEEYERLTTCKEGKLIDAFADEVQKLTEENERHVSANKKRIDKRKEELQSELKQGLSTNLTEIKKAIKTEADDIREKHTKHAEGIQTTMRNLPEQVKEEAAQ